MIEYFTVIGFCLNLTVANKINNELLPCIILSLTRSGKQDKKNGKNFVPLLEEFVCNYSLRLTEILTLALQINSFRDSLVVIWTGNVLWYKSD